MIAATRSWGQTSRFSASLPRVLVTGGLLLVSFAALVAHPASAQQPAAAVAGQVGVQQPPTIDRDRIDRQGPGLPRQAPPVALPSAGPVLIEAAAAAIKLTRVRFEGSTLPPTTLARAASRFAGAPLTGDTLQKLANAVSEAYAASDIAFYAVSIPAQAATGGVLTIRVVEGRIAGYKLKKKTRSTPSRLIDAQLQPLLHDNPTRRSLIERTLSLLRDVPGQSVQADLRRTDKPDELSLDLTVERKQVEVTLDVNNRGVVNVVSGVQAQLGVTVNGLLREGDSTRLSSYLPFQASRYQFYSASHSTPLGASGTTLGVSGAYVRTRTREPEVKGEAKQFGIVVAHPLIRTYKRNLSLSASLDGTNSQNYFLDSAFGGFRTRTVRLGANWSVIDKADGYAVSATLSQGVDALGAEPTLGYSETGYRKANLQAVGIKQVSGDVTVRAGVRAQYSRDNLPTTERFALGGAGAGVAFRYGVYTADKAAAADVEVSWQLLGAPGGRGLSAFVNADGVVARTYARPAYALPGRNLSLASASAGVRITPLKGWSATAQVAVPVKVPAPEFGHKPRFFFSISRTV